MGLSSLTHTTAAAIILSAEPHWENILVLGALGQQEEPVVALCHTLPSVVLTPRPADFTTNTKTSVLCVFVWPERQATAPLDRSCVYVCLPGVLYSCCCCSQVFHAVVFACGCCAVLEGIVMCLLVSTLPRKVVSKAHG